MSKPKYKVVTITKKYQFDADYEDETCFECALEIFSQDDIDDDDMKIEVTDKALDKN